jgi:hypothetical protein
MIVISNTGPINYLVLIEEIGILPVLFGTVSIPQAVERELGSAQAPDKIRKWLGSSPRLVAGTGGGARYLPRGSRRW